MHRQENIFLQGLTTLGYFYHSK